MLLNKPSLFTETRLACIIFFPVLALLELIHSLFLSTCYPFMLHETYVFPLTAHL